MNTEFFSLMLTRKELEALHKALIQESFIQDDIRAESDEDAAPSPLLERVCLLLNSTDKEHEKLTSQVDEELWQHAWYSFTDEWAWHRARQEVMQDTKKNRQHLDAAALDKRVEQRYEQHFERFVNELDMRSAAPHTTKTRKQRTKKS